MRDVCVWFKWKVFVAHFVPRFTILSLNVATDKKDKTAVPKTQISHNRKWGMDIECEIVMLQKVLVTHKVILLE